MVDLNKLKINDITLVKLNKYNICHKKEIKRLNKQENVKKYLWNLNNTFDDKESSTYLLKKENKYVGLIWLSNEFSSKEIYFSIAINDKYKNKHIATHILNNLSNYLLDNNYINKIKLDIENKNYPSIHSALNSGFKVEKEFTNFKIYSKKKERR